MSACHPRLKLLKIFHFDLFFPAPLIHSSAHPLQVQAIRPYIGKQADELSLEVSDVVNVLKKMSDGGCWHGDPCMAMALVFT